jgi:hypothetical protein
MIDAPFRLSSRLACPFFTSHTIGPLTLRRAVVVVVVQCYRQTMGREGGLVSDVGRHRHQRPKQVAPPSCHVCIFGHVAHGVNKHDDDELRRSIHKRSGTRCRQPKVIAPRRRHNANQKLAVARSQSRFLVRAAGCRYETVCVCPASLGTCLILVLTDHPSNRGHEPRCPHERSCGPPVLPIDQRRQDQRGDDRSDRTRGGAGPTPDLIRSVMTQHVLDS